MINMHGGLFKGLSTLIAQSVLLHDPKYPKRQHTPGPGRQFCSMLGDGIAYSPASLLLLQLLLLHTVLHKWSCKHYRLKAMLLALRTHLSWKAN